MLAMGSSSASAARSSWVTGMSARWAQFSRTTSGRVMASTLQQGASLLGSAQRRVQS